MQNTSMLNYGAVGSSRTAPGIVCEIYLLIWQRSRRYGPSRRRDMTQTKATTRFLYRQFRALAWRAVNIDEITTGRHIPRFQAHRKDYIGLFLHLSSSCKGYPRLFYERDFRFPYRGENNTSIGIAQIELEMIFDMSCAKHIVLNNRSTTGNMNSYISVSFLRFLSNRDNNIIFVQIKLYITILLLSQI